MHSLSKNISFEERLIRLNQVAIEQLKLLTNYTQKQLEKKKWLKEKVCVVTGTRPENGINPMRWDEIIGTVATKDYKEDELIWKKKF